LFDRVIQTSGDSTSGHHALTLFDRVIQTSGDSTSGHRALTPTCFEIDRRPLSGKVDNADGTPLPCSGW
jgi:hypothetical protein